VFHLREDDVNQEVYGLPEYISALQSAWLNESAIKNVSKDDVLAAHRVPPGLLGIVPTNAGGFGNAPDALGVFIDNEIRPLMQRFRELNEWAGEELVRFAAPLRLGAEGE
jgi:capsid portal protein